MPTTPPVLDVQNVGKVYKTGSEEMYALRNVTFAANAGEFISIVGTSGSGKSTLMNILGCLDPVKMGKYYFCGKDISECSEGELADVRSRQIGFVFQSFNLLPKLTLQENVALPLIYSHHDVKDRLALAAEVLSSVGLSDRLNHLPDAISGGQRQRVAVARALVNKPKLLLADEPTGNLDSATSKEILTLFSKMRDQYNPTIVIVTHDEYVAEYAERIITLFDGQLYADVDMVKLEKKLTATPV